MTRAVFFDFDGVIVDSMHVKTEAFVALYAPYGAEIAEKVRCDHLENAGVPRHDKLRRWQRDLVGGPHDDAAIEALAARFGDLVKARVIAAPEIAGARAALETLSARMPLAVVSATPEAELREILEARGLMGYFAVVHGAPTKKVEVLRRAVAETGDAAALLMIGDAIADHGAAVGAGVPFLGVVPEGAESPFPPGTPTVPDLTTLADRVLAGSPA